MPKEFNKVLNAFHIPVWMFILLLAIFVLRIPSFFEPYWYGDEAITLTLGQAVRQGLTLYKDIHDNKPPLLYLAGALAGNVFWLRVILAAWNLTSIFFFWKLAAKLWDKKQLLVQVATLTFAILSTLPLLEGNIANGEIFMIGPTIVAVYLLFSKEKLGSIGLFGAGLVLSLGVLFKVPAIFDAGAIFVLWFTQFLAHKKFGTLLKNTAFFSLGILTVIFLTLAFFAAKGALSDYIRAAFFQNLGYVSTWRTGGWGTNNFLLQNGPIIVRFLILIVLNAIFIILYLRRKLNLNLFFVSSWFLFSLFGALLSERPYPHYLLQVVPPLSFLVANAIADRTRYQFLSYPLFMLLAAALFFYKFYYYPVVSYYKNFILWTTRSITTQDFFAHFDKRIPRNYELAKFILESVSDGDKIFVWGNDTEIYALTHILPPERYVAAYHIADFKAQDEVLTALQKNPPRYIITTAPFTDFPALQSMLAENYFVIAYKNNAIIWLHLNTPKDKTRQN